MEATELRELLRQNKMAPSEDETEESGRQRRMIKDFRMHTGCTVDFLTKCDEGMLMSMWAQFAIERIEEVS